MTNTEPFAVQAQPPAASKPPWHALTVGEALHRVDSSSSGLEPKEARGRLAAYGPNRLRSLPGRGALIRFLLQFHNLLIYVLLGAAAIAAVLGQVVDAAVIVGVVLINASIGFVQEGKAEKAIQAIRHMLSLRARVLRGGERYEVPAEDLVPGDVVLLDSGDKVPADLRLLHVKNLRVDEAALTGESQPVDKQPGPVPETAPLGDRLSMAYTGTLVAYGQARGVVVATGEQTEIGRISRLLEQVEEVSTPLLRQMTRFGRTAYPVHSRRLGGGVSVRLVAARLWRGRHVHGRRRPGRSCDTRGAAGHHDHHACDRRATHGAPTCDRPASTCSRSTGLRHRDLYR